MKADLQPWLDGTLYPALFSRLDAAFPAFGWRRQARRWVATRWPVDFPEAVEHPNPDRLMVYEDEPAYVKIHGRGVVRLLHLVSGEPRPTGERFTEAVRQLATLAGLDATPLDREQTPEDLARIHARDARRAALHLAADCAQQRLRSDAGAEARAYLLNRGLSTDDLENFGLGLYDLAAVRKALDGSGLPRDTCASVIFPKLDGYAVVPWADAYGYPLTLYGRWPGKETPDGRPKTMALPGEGTKATPLYLDRALRAGHRELVAVEGLFDALLLQARGETRAVAYVAAQFSTNQIESVTRRSIERVYLCGDPDGGGDKGTERNVEHLETAGVRAYVMPRLPDNLDPDEVLLRDGIEAWRERVAAAVPGRVWQAEQILAGITPDSTEAARRKALDALRPVYAHEGPEADLDHEAIVSLAARRTGYPKATIRKHLAPDDQEQSKASTPEPTPTPAYVSAAVVEEAAPALDPWRFHATDTGNAERLVAHHGQDLRYCTKWGKWLAWDGRRWAEDEHNVTRHRAKLTALSIYREAVAITGVDDRSQARRKELATWASKSEARDRREAMVALAQSEPGVSISPTILDADPWLLNVENGTLNLKTGQLQPHRREDMITKLAPVVYDPHAEAPVFLAFLDSITKGDKELQSFLQRFFGFSLTGETIEHLLVSCWGHGSNGKSTLLKTFLRLLGDYAYQAPADLLMAKKNDSHPTDKAGLFKKRLVCCLETPPGRAMDETQMKALTGGDLVTARRMREDFWTFEPTHKLIIATNHKPQVRTTDHGTWRRQKLVPFTVQIPKSEQDKQLPHKLAAEFPGILRWAVEGCLAWQREGDLGEPKVVREATEAWREESDSLGAFLAAECELGEGFKAEAAGLFAAYQRFAVDTDADLMSKQAFGRRLTERGMVSERTKAARMWAGLKLKPIKPQAGRGAEKSKTPEKKGDDDGKVTLSSGITGEDELDREETPELTVTNRHPSPEAEANETAPQPNGEQADPAVSTDRPVIIDQGNGRGRMRFN